MCDKERNIRQAPTCTTFTFLAAGIQQRDPSTRAALHSVFEVCSRVRRSCEDV
jgi:hypothetical protein